MAELNPFEPPSEKPPSDARLTDRQLLELPESARARESLGDRYFHQLLVLLGVGIIVVPWLFEFPFRSNKLGLLIVGLGLWGWVREARKP